MVIVRALLALALLLAPSLGRGADVLLQSSDLSFVGSFRVQHVYSTPRLSYGGGGLAYRSAANGGPSLYTTGYGGEVYEISIPTPVNTGTLGSMNSASYVQSGTDLLGTERHKINITGGSFPNWTRAAIGNNAATGGMLVWDSKLLQSVYGYYDGNCDAELSHYTTALTWSSGPQWSGYYRLGPHPNGGNSCNANVFGGGMADIPDNSGTGGTNWQTALGGTVITGTGGASVVSNGSAGPTIAAFDPADMASIDPAPTTTLASYPAGHQLILGSYDYPGPATYYNPGVGNTPGYHGMVFPVGSKTVLVFGSVGTGLACYGHAVSDPNRDMMWMNATTYTTSSTLTVASSGSQSATVPAGLGSLVGKRITFRSNNTTPVKVIDGTVTAYSGTTLTFTAGLYPAGSGSWSDWTWSTYADTFYRDCYDLGFTGQNHAYPYKYGVWFYSADDLAAAGSGTYVASAADEASGRFWSAWNYADDTHTALAAGQTVRPWNVRPYAIAYLDDRIKLLEPFRRINGAAYDPASQRIYLIAANADTAEIEPWPLVHVLQVSLSPPVAAPQISGQTPAGAQACTSNPRNVTIGVTTDVAATCKYGTADAAYASLPSTFGTTGGTTHSQAVSLACGGSHTYYVRCSAGGVSNAESSTITFSVATPPPPAGGHNMTISPSGAGGIRFGGGSQRLSW